MKKISAITIDSDTFIEEIGGNYSDIEKEKIITKTYQKAAERVFDKIYKYNLKTTFFLITSHLKNEEASKTCKHILEMGNEIADHTYSHNRNFMMSKKSEIEKELSNSKKMMMEKLGITPLGFRSPGAEINLETIKILIEQKYFYDSSSNTSLLYEKAKKLYFKIKRQNYIHYKISNYDIPIKIGTFYEFPITISSFFTIPLFNFFMSKFNNLGLKIINDTIKNKEYINYTIHLHELISPQEIIGVNIKKGIMNIIDQKISKKLIFLDKALYILKENSDIRTLKDIYYNLLYGAKNDKNKNLF